MSAIAVVDADNFYASAERVFDPALHNRPLVVLGNNDGIIVSRSPDYVELKANADTPASSHPNIQIHRIKTC